MTQTRKAGSAQQSKSWKAAQTQVQSAALKAQRVQTTKTTKK